MIFFIVLQKHFKAIEAFALDREEIEEVPDHTSKRTVVGFRPVWPN